MGWGWGVPGCGAKTIAVSVEAAAPIHRAPVMNEAACMSYFTPTPDGVSTFIISMLYMSTGRLVTRKRLAQVRAANPGRAGTPCLLLFCSTIRNNGSSAPKPKINEQMHVAITRNFLVLCICLLINKWRTSLALSFSLSVNYSSDFHVSKWP